jgi:hypothetical protein
VLGHIACFEGCSPLLLHCRLRSLLATDNATPALHSCRVSCALVAAPLSSSAHMQRCAQLDFKDSLKKTIEF